MQRRDALKRLGVGLGLAAATPGLGGPAKPGSRPERPPWKTAVGLNGFASASRKYRKTFPIWEVLDFASGEGFHGVELVGHWPMGGYPRADEKKRIDALRRMVDAFGLRIFSLQQGAGGAFDPDADARKRWIEEIGDRARFAKAVGADCIGLWPGGPLRGQTIDQAIERLAESFGEVGKIVDDLGLLAGFEIEPPFVFNTEEHLLRILDRTGHAAVKTIYDPSHFDLMSGSTGRPHEMLRRIGVGAVAYVHLTDTDGTLRDGGTSKHLPCGDGHVDVDASLATLRDGGFAGWIMIDAWEIPDPYDACAKGKRAIDRARPRR
ncbi:MAG: sugar phosphate isomerase/epimerase family protein [Planctomycetota bacterium]